MAKVERTHVTPELIKIRVAKSPGRALARSEATFPIYQAS
jgi:hypothetical protein